MDKNIAWSPAWLLRFASSQRCLQVWCWCGCTFSKRDSKQTGGRLQEDQRSIFNARNIRISQITGLCCDGGKLEGVTGRGNEMLLHLLNLLQPHSSTPSLRCMYSLYVHCIPTTLCTPTTSNPHSWSPIFLYTPQGLVSSQGSQSASSLHDEQRAPSACLVS